MIKSSLPTPDQVVCQRSKIRLWRCCAGINEHLEIWVSGMKSHFSKEGLVQFYVVWGVLYGLGERLWLVEGHADVVRPLSSQVLDAIVCCDVNEFQGFIVLHSALCNDLSVPLAGDGAASWSQGDGVGVSDAVTFILGKEPWEGLSWDCTAEQWKGIVIKVTNLPSWAYQRLKIYWKCETGCNQKILSVLCLFFFPKHWTNPGSKKVKE